MIEGLNLVKSYTSMKSLNKDSLSRNDILIDKNFDDTNRGLWMMIREDNPDIKDRDQLLKILRAFLRDMYPDEVGPDGSIPEARISDHIRGGKKVKDGDHALLIRDLTTRVFV